MHLCKSFELLYISNSFEKDFLCVCLKVKREKGPSYLL